MKSTLRSRRSTSPVKQSPVKVTGGTYDSELMRVLRERDELQCMLDKSERHMSEIQANVRVLTAERDKTKTLYQQAQEEIAELRRQVMRSKVSRGPKYSVTAHSILKRVEAERDEATSDLHRMSTERDSLRERLKVSQETAISERAHLEQRVEDLQNAILTLEQERGEQKSRQAQMRETTMSLEEEISTLGRKFAASEDELNHLRNECSMLRLSNTRAESTLSDTQRRLTIRIEEMQKVQEKNKQLDEMNESLQKEMRGLKEELMVLQDTVSDRNQRKNTLEEHLERKNEELDDKENNIYSLKLQIEELETTVEHLREMANNRERELDEVKRKLLDSGDELNVVMKIKDATLRENTQLRDELDQVRMENQTLQHNLDETTQEIEILKRKVQNYVSDVSRIEDLLAYKERECKELQECRLELRTSDSENRRLKERLESLETSLQASLSAERSCNAKLSQLNLELQQQEEELRKVQSEHSQTQHNLEKTRELCVKLDAGKKAVQQELESSRSELELLRKQLGRDREKELNRQLSSQERLAEIQLLREKLTVADSKASTQSREMAQLRIRSAQLEADLETTRRQLSCERFERKRAVQELHSLELSSSMRSPILTSTLRTSPLSIRRSLSPYASYSPECSHYVSPEHLPKRRSPDRSVTFSGLFD
ncbi:testis-specific gene 10 protein [Trichomycterus rosablanca]|uniref:testis-specific gene 10 protein n=1 Tax=Trichomycterus rosablanca TaxID=2290929 RepID=UPI002F35BF2D